MVSLKSILEEKLRKKSLILLSIMFFIVAAFNISWLYVENEKAEKEMFRTASDLFQGPVRSKDLIMIKGLLRGILASDPSTEVCLRLSSGIVVSHHKCQSSLYQKVKIKLSDDYFFLGLKKTVSYTSFFPILFLILLLLVLLILIQKNFGEISLRISSDLRKVTSPKNDKQFNYSELEKACIQIQEGAEAIKTREKNKAIVQFGREVSTIAHDIKGPLKLMEILINSLEQNKIDSTKKSRLLRALNSVHGISENLLNKYKANVTQKQEREKIDVCLELKEVIADFSLTYQDKVIETHLSMEQSLQAVSIQMNAVVFRRVITNILKNSYDAFEDRGAVDINLKANEEKAIIIIQDNGSGIPEHIIDNVFEEGFSTKGNNTGIGLGYVKKEIEAYKGEIVISSSKTGTRVEIILPVSHLTELREGQNIVMVDDDFLWREVWHDEMNKRGEHFSSYESSQALLESSAEYNKETRFFIDLNLKGSDLNGVDLCKALLKKGFSNITLQTSMVDRLQEIREVLPKSINVIEKLSPTHIA